MDSTVIAKSQVATSWQGIVRFLHRTPRAFLPMRSFPMLELVEGRGIEGDRYLAGQETGFYSHKPEEGRQITLFEMETLDALRRDKLGQRVLTEWAATRPIYDESLDELFLDSEIEDSQLRMMFACCHPHLAR